MTTSLVSRRTFIRSTAVPAASTIIYPLLSHSAPDHPVQVACVEYPYLMRTKAEGIDLDAMPDYGLKTLKAHGLDGFEIWNATAEKVKRLAPLLKEQGLGMRSVFTSGNLCDPEPAKETVQKAQGVLEQAKAIGSELLLIDCDITQEEPKTLDQLAHQASQLDVLGRECKRNGLILALHFHLQGAAHGARDVRWMMDHVDPEHLSLCLDVHWIFQGAEYSTAALFDFAEEYASRVAELHLRQTKNRVITEFLCEGDIEYKRISTLFAEKSIHPYLVMDLIVQDETPKTMSTCEAFQKSAHYVREVFV